MLLDPISASFSLHIHSMSHAFSPRVTPQNSYSSMTTVRVSFSHLQLFVWWFKIFPWELSFMEEDFMAWRRREWKTTASYRRSLFSPQCPSLESLLNYVTNKRKSSHWDIDIENSVKNSRYEEISKRMKCVFRLLFFWVMFEDMLYVICIERNLTHKSDRRKATLTQKYKQKRIAKELSFSFHSLLKFRSFSTIFIGGLIMELLHWIKSESTI